MSAFSRTTIFHLTMPTLWMMGSDPPPSLRRGSPSVQARRGSRPSQIWLAPPRAHATPDVVIHLDTTPATALARCTHTSAEGLALEDAAELDAAVREIAGAMRDHGCEVFTRKWDAFGKVAAVRDTILCAAPADSRSGSSLDGSASAAALRHASRPSEAAVERMLRDAWAAAQPPRSQRTSRSSSVNSLSTPASPVTSPPPSMSCLTPSRAPPPSRPHMPLLATPPPTQRRPQSHRPLAPSVVSASGVFAGLELELDEAGVSASQCDSPEGASPATILTRLDVA